MTLKGYRRVDQPWFSGSTEDLAYRLLNAVLVHESDQGTTIGRIVECEMYQGPEDRGAHSFGGMPTPRTQVMYQVAGLAYVYLIYGMHWCLNVVAQGAGTPHAILIRALEPLSGLDLMTGRQKPSKSPASATTVAKGPGKLCRAMDIDRRHYGHPLWMPPLYLALPEVPWRRYQVARGPRINIAYAKEAAEYPWRFWVDQSPFVSQPNSPRTSIQASPPEF